MPQRLFISYARADDEPFATDLYEALTKEGYAVWWDKQAMENRGSTFIQEVKDAIEQVDRLLLVVTPGAAESVYVRDEWEYALTLCKVVTPLLRLGGYELLPEPFKNVHAIEFREQRARSEAMDELRRILNSGVDEPGKLFAVPELPPHYLPRETELAHLRDQLLADIHKAAVVTGTKRRAGLQGMGGIGKTVLATAVARDCRIRRAFTDGVYWITLGQNPQLLSLQSQLGEMLGDNARNFGNLDDGKRRLSTLLVDKRALVILDDVWEPEHVKAFDALGTKCRMLITTRNAEPLKMFGIEEYTLNVLGEAEALALLADWSGLPAVSLPPEAPDIARECGFLPLALAMVGALLRGKPDDWPSILQRLQSADLERIRADFPHYPYPDLLRAIQIGVTALEPPLQRRYCDLAVFPDDVAIPAAAIKTLWRTAGVSEQPTERMLAELVDRSLLRKDETGCFRLHDLQVDFVRKYTTDLPALHERLLAGYNPNGHAWHTIKHDGYLHLYLARHLLAAGRQDELHMLLTSTPDWMRRKYVTCVGDAAYLADLDLLINLYNDPLTPDELIRLVELYSCRQIINHRVARYDDRMLRVLVLLGRESEALSYARLRPEPDERFRGLRSIYSALPSTNTLKASLLTEMRRLAESILNGFDRVSVLVRLAQVLIQAEQSTLADKYFSEAETAGLGIQTNHRRAFALLLLAEALVQQSKFGDAERVALSIPYHDRDPNVSIIREEGEHQAAALADLATALAKAGQFDEAERIARSVHSYHSRLWVFTELAKALIEAGQDVRGHAFFAEAERMIVPRLTNGPIHEARTVVEALLQVGQLNDAERLATLAPDNDTRAFLLPMIAAALAQIGQDERARTLFADAERAVMRSSNHYNQAQAWSGLTEALAKAGHLEDVERIIPLIQDEFVRASALGAWASALIRVERYDEAEGAARQIPVGQTGTTALTALVASLIQGGQLERAEQIAQRIEYASTRAETLCKVAEALALAGQHAEAQVVFAKVERLTESAQSQAIWGGTLNAIAGVLIDMEHKTQARALLAEVSRVIERLPDDDRERATTKLIDTLAQAGEIDQANRLAQDTKAEPTRDWRFFRLVMPLAKLKQFQKAEDLARRLHDQYRRGEALSNLVARLAHLGQFKRATKIAESIQSETYSSQAQKELVTALASTGQFEQAVRIAETIPESYTRDTARQEIASALANVGRLHDAEQVIHNIQKDEPRGWAIGSLVEALVRDGQFDRAEQAAATLKSDDKRVKALCAVAVALEQAHQSVRAHRLFAEAENITRGIRGDLESHTARHALLWGLVRARQFEQGEQFVRSIREEHERESALGDLARFLAHTGEFERAESIIWSIQSSYMLRWERVELSLVYAYQLKFCRALSHLAAETLYEFVLAFCDWREPLLKFAPERGALLINIFQATSRILAWEQPSWGQVYDILSASPHKTN